MFKYNGKRVETIKLCKPGMQNLSAAIINAAIKDWVRAKRTLDKDKNNYTARATVDEVERFFLSEWFDVLSDLDGETILEGLKLKYERGEISKRNKTLRF